MRTNNSPKTDTPSIEKRKGSRRSSIQRKITLWAGLCLTLLSLSLIAYSVLTLRQRSIDSSTREATAIAESNAKLVKSQLDLPNYTAHALAASLGAVKDPSIPITLSREEANGMLRKTLINNPSFLGTYTVWELNAFDGLDARYIRAVAHDNTGRFIPYWVRGDDGIIHTEALTQYVIPALGDWYALARSSKQEVTIAPIFRRIQGREIATVSFVIPIVQDDNFYGIAGVDAPLSFVQELVDNIDLFDSSANAALFTDAGTLIAVRQRPEMTGMTANSIYEDFEEIRPQLGASFTRLSPDGKYLQIFSPIDLSEAEGTTGNWVMGLIIPFEKITAPATNAAIRQAAISVGLIAITLVLLWFLAGQIVRPMQVLTDAANTISQGQWNVTAEVHSNDETEVLANAFNSMTLQLQSLFSSLEQRVAERTRALATTTEVSRRLSTILDRQALVTEVVNQVSNAFGYYHTQIYIYDETGEHLVMAGGTGTAGETMLAGGHKILKGQGLVGRAAKANEPILVSDTSQNPDWLPNPLLPETKAEVAIPISAGNLVLGVLDVQHNNTERLNQDDVSSLQSIANQVAVALQNIFAYENTQSQNERLAALNQLSEALAASQSFDEIFKASGKYLKQIVGADQVSMTRLHESGEYLEVFNLDEIQGAVPVGVKLPLTETILANVISERRAMVVPDLAQDEHWENKKLAEQGLRSTMVLPLVGSQLVFGTINFGNAQPNSFTEQDQRLATQAERQITPMLENRGMFEQTQFRAMQQEKIISISEQIQNASTVEAALQVAVRELGRALGHKSTLVALDPGARTDRHKATVNE